MQQESEPLSHDQGLYHSTTYPTTLTGSIPHYWVPHHVTRLPSMSSFPYHVPRSLATSPGLSLSFPHLPRWRALLSQTTQHRVGNPPSDVSMAALAEKLWRQVLLLSRGRVSLLKPTSGPTVNGANGNSVSKKRVKKY